MVLFVIVFVRSPRLASEFTSSCQHCIAQILLSFKYRCSNLLLLEDLLLVYKLLLSKLGVRLLLFNFLQRENMSREQQRQFSVLTN